MSLNIVPSRLVGFDQHLTPPSLEEMSRLLDRVMASTAAQSKFWFHLNELSSFRRVMVKPAEITTDDGYTYQVGILFEEGARRLAILIPHRGDQERTDDVSFDRAVAVYTSQSFSLPRAEKLIQDLVGLLKKILVSAKE